MAFFLSVSVAVCPDGLSWCQDPLKGILCYNGTYTSCVLDSNQRSYTLCGTGLQSCGGICFHPNLNSCNNSVLVAPTLDFTIEVPTSKQIPTTTTSSPSTSSSPPTMSSETRQNDTQAPSISSSTRPVNNYPSPIPGPGGAPQRYQPPTTSSTSPSTSSTRSSSTSSSTSPKTTTSSTSPKTSTTATKATAYPMPVPGPGQAPPRYVPPTITESF